MRPRLRTIGHIALVTRDLERLTAFYADVFGADSPYERSAGDERGGLGFIRVGDCALHVFERPDGPLGGVEDAQGGTPFARGRIDHFSLEAASVAEFVDARERLVALGASSGEVVDFGPLVSVFFTDPDGYQLELSLTKPPVWEQPFPTVAPQR